MGFLSLFDKRENFGVDEGAEVHVLGRDRDHRQSQLK